MRGGGIDEICQRQLMDVAQSLEAPRVQYFPLVAIQADENVDGVTDLVNVLRHVLQVFRSQVKFTLR